MSLTKRSLTLDYIQQTGLEDPAKHAMVGSKEKKGEKNNNKKRKEKKTRSSKEEQKFLENCQQIKLTTFVYFVSLIKLLKAQVQKYCIFKTNLMVYIVQIQTLNLLLLYI